ncbi:MAG TPA: FkbM family methyltransferase [Noviherbaspirillum sp.]|nr:FkbM family methyltransferase [Noviherbaspirillum sp.]
MRSVLNYLQDITQRRLHPPADPLDPEPQHSQQAPAGDDNERKKGDPFATRKVLTKIGSTEYQIVSDDDYLDHIEGEFEPDMARLFDALIKPGDVVLDVGANIGCTSILFAGKARRVYSFEPSPTTFRYLEENLRSARLDNVTAVNIALGKENGSQELVFAANNRSGAFVSEQSTASDGHLVEWIHVMKGDDFVGTHDIPRVDFIKIDVEGFEKQVIEGLTGTIARDRPAVVLELNHWCLNVFQRMSVPDFLDFLRAVFPYLYAVEKNDIRNLHDRNEAYHVMYHHIVSGFQYANLIGAFSVAQLDGLARRFELRIH